ncbi:MAG TPA: FAD-dependent tricarballylate dehydrogenase TcuA [Stellaceae bacterium]|nr:FAD-dependent tricarballylate dehydrogenase TcuA [Stellaceae bacterium]
MAPRGAPLDVDVLVVGAGNAAFTAALAARQAGCTVRVLEKAPQEFRGGNTRFTGGVFRFTYGGLDDLLPIVKDTDAAADVVVDPYPPEAFARDLQRVTGGRTDPVLSRVLIARSYDTVRWMAELGVRFEFSRAVTGIRIAGTNRTRLQPGAAIRAHHEGIGLSQSLFDLAAAHGVEVLYERQVTRILGDESGRVVGVAARGPAGIERHHAGAVIVASGGFQANPEMRTAYLGAPWGLVKARGSRYNTGELIRELLAFGAQSFGDWAGRHATPIDADAPQYGDLKLTDKTNRLSYPYGVLVNCDGERFVDEGADFNSYTYAAYGAAILAQRNATAFEIFDSRAFPLLEKRYETGVPVEAATIDELVAGIAQRWEVLRIDAARMRATIAEYNAAADRGDGFRPDALDGMRTRGLRPEKTNWAIPIETPPFRAYAVTGGITFTFGGIRISERAEIVDGVDRPIPGLYASGELTGGFFFLNYPLGCGLTRGAVFGKLAGESAAAFVGRSAPTV